MDFSDKVKYLCDSRKITVKSLEVSVGASNGSLSKHSEPRFSLVVAVSKFFNIPLEFFASDLSGISDDESYIISVFRNFNSVGKAEFIDYLEYMQTKPTYIKSNGSELVENA